MERYDAIVVGAGPAGSATAIRLARGGARVLLVDKARFPRDKPCGGGLTLRAVRELPVSVEPVVEHVVDRFGLRLRYGTRIERQSREPLVLMTQRIRLDHHLLEQAAVAGAEVRDGVKVTDVSVDANGARSRSTAAPSRRTCSSAPTASTGSCERRSASAATTCSASRSRATSRTRWSETGIGGSPSSCSRTSPAATAGCSRRATTSMSVSAAGSAKARRCEIAWPSFAAHYAIPLDRVESIRGHRLPLRRPDSVAARGRALLVGDAAGLVDPLSGDGMYEAFVSARLASEAILELLAGRTDSLDAYGQAIRAALSSLQSASWGAKIALDRYPRATFALGRSALAWRVMERMMRGEIKAPSDARGLTRVPMRGIEALARRAGDPGRAYRLESNPA